MSIQVDQNDPDVMNQTLSNATNIIEQYKTKGEAVQIEVVTYGPVCRCFARTHRR